MSSFSQLSGNSVVFANGVCSSCIIGILFFSPLLDLGTVAENLSVALNAATDAVSCTE